MGRKSKPEKLAPVISTLTAKRREAGLSKAQLADRLGYSKRLVYHWEDGTITPSFQSLINWCQFFNMDLDARGRE